METLHIKGARQHNLKNVELELPKNKLIVFTGVSGSGKTSLAFDTIYAEGQRRYVESLSSYARQFLGIMNKPDVDSITGLSPAISIDQKSTSHNPRSTVGTVTEIYDYFRLLYARIGHPHCHQCGREISRQTSSQIVDAVIKMIQDESSASGKKPVRLLVLSPIVRDRKGEFTSLFDNVRAKGIRQIRVDGHIMGLDEDIILIKTNKHSIDAVCDKLTIDKSTARTLSADNKSLNESLNGSFRQRIQESIEQALVLSQGLVIVSLVKDASFDFPDKPKMMTDRIFSEKFSCPVCNISIPEIEPRTFSFNTPHGACPDCSGLGTILSVDPTLVIAPALSITEGGIIPFEKTFSHDTWYSRLVLVAVSAHGIDPKKPIGSLSDRQKEILLHGTGDQTYTVYGTNRFGEQTVIHETFTGIMSELKRRYTQTESDYIRMEIEKYMREEICKTCHGKRLKKESLTVTVCNKSIYDATHQNIKAARDWMESLLPKTNTILSVQEHAIAASIIKEIIIRLTFLMDVGLEYLTIDRTATTLSGGEAQRIRLASQIGTGLSGVLYVLDEPSIGLHPRDNSKLIETLKHLRDLSNTVIVVEHDREMMESADILVDFGPGAGLKGGEIVASGTVSDVKKNPKSLTAKYLTYKKTIERPNKFPIKNDGKYITLKGARQNNLKNITVSFPLGVMTAVTGVSGSGKSTLIVETLYRAILASFRPYTKDRPGVFDSIEGLENIDKAILIDQSPIGRTPRSNPATYTGVFTHIRELYASLPASKMRGFTPGRFSFNVKGGRCEACEGEGQKRIEMQFLSDVYVTCEVCNGTRYSNETLEISFHEKNIAEVLDMTIEEAYVFFIHQPILRQKLEVIKNVGLGYMHVGQPATTLSGGEAQRIKLATELMKRATGRTIYILDEPTTGLHFADLENLLSVLHTLTSYGNTIIIIEHNPDIIRNADWIIDLGPEGGDLGGEIVAVGTQKTIQSVHSSYTGQIMKKLR